MNINKEKYWKNFQLLTIVVMVGQLWCNLIQAWDLYYQLDFFFFCSLISINWKYKTLFFVIFIYFRCWYHSKYLFSFLVFPQPPYGCVPKYLMHWSMIMRLLQHITTERYKKMMIRPLYAFNELTSHLRF